MTPEERRRMRLARTGPLSSGIPNPIFRNNPEIGMPISDKAWYEIPPHMTLPNDSRYGTISDYREGLDPSTGGSIDPYKDQIVLDYLQSKRPTSTPTSVGGGYDTFLEDQPSTLAKSYESLDEFPKDREGNYEPIDVRKLSEDQVKEAERLAMLDEAQWAAEINREISSANKLSSLTAAIVGGQPSTMPFVSTSKPSGSSGQAKNIEEDLILNQYFKLMEAGQEPRDKESFEKFISSLTPSADGVKFVWDTLASNYDWGDWEKLQKINPEDPLGHPLEIWRQKKSPEYLEAIKAGWQSESLANDRDVIKRDIAKRAIRELFYNYGRAPTEAEFIEFYNNKSKDVKTEPEYLAALSAWAEEQGYDNPYEIFMVDGTPIRVRRGTLEYENASRSGRPMSESEWATMDFAEQRQELFKKVDKLYQQYKNITGFQEGVNFLPPIKVRTWITQAFKDDLHLFDDKYTVDKAVKQWLELKGIAESNEFRVQNLNRTLQDMLDKDVGDFDAYAKVINESNLPLEGDNSQKTLIDKWQKIFNEKLGWSEQPAVMMMNGSTIAGKKLGRVDPDGTIIYNPNAPFIPDDIRYSVKKADGEDDKIVFSPAELSRLGLEEMQLVWKAAGEVRKTQGFSEIDEGFRDVHQRYYGIKNNLTDMAKQPRGQRAWGPFDQQIADMWKKLTDESMITSEEFRTILEGAGFKQQVITFFNRKFSEDKTGSFLTPEQRTSILMMTRSALEYKQRQAKVYLDELKKQWMANPIEEEGYNKATAAIAELVNTELEVFDLEDSDLAEALMYSPVRNPDDKQVVSEVGDGERKAGDYSLTIPKGQGNNPSAWILRTPDGDIPWDDSCEHKQMLDPNYECG